MRVKINPELCDGTGMCEQTCPEVFELKEGISTVIVDDVPPDVEQSCRNAAEECPAAAILIEE